MNKATILLLLFAVGLAFAIQPSDGWNAGAQGRYNPTQQANITTEGGNVTPLNLSSNVSTERWAGFWGNVTGNLVLSPATAIFYSWAWSSASGGEVCAVAASSGFDWSNVQSASASAVDTAWNFAAGTDNATNTYTSAACSVNVAGTAIGATAGNATGAGNFETCVLSDGGAAAKDNLAFCVNITQGGGLFNGQLGDYELLVPANETNGAFETYYFWIELD